MKVYLVRHGESMANTENVFYGRYNSPLSEHGWEQARAVHEKLKNIHVQRVYTSPLQRAIDTGRTVAEGMHIPHIVDERLIECSVGEWEMTPASEIFGKYPELRTKNRHKWASFKCPGGECGADVVERVRPFAEEIIKANENVLIAAHLGSIRALMVCFLGLSPDFMDHLDIQQGVYTLLDVDDGFATLEVVNG